MFLNIGFFLSLGWLVIVAGSFESLPMGLWFGPRLKTLVFRGDNQQNLKLT
jgi:hypothetical protein